MLREIKAHKRDVHPGNICHTDVFQLDEYMTVSELIHYIADNFLSSFLHYQWEICDGEPFQTLGYIGCNRQDRNPALKTPDGIINFLNQQINSDDLIQCYVPTHLTLKDLDITEVYCIDR